MTTLLDNYTEKEIALALHLWLAQSDIDLIDWYDGENLTQEQEEHIAEVKEKIDEAREIIDEEDYLVLTDEEANDKRMDYLENALDDYLVDVIKKHGYADVSLDARWNMEVSLSMNFSDRWSDLSWYDWVENEEEVNWTTYYIYRQN